MMLKQTLHRPCCYKPEKQSRERTNRCMLRSVSSICIQPLHRGSAVQH